MTSLTAIFGNSQTDNEESEKLLELYWNRAELKKEFANLREQTFKLSEQVKAEQGRTARYQQKYEHLENLLLDPEWAHNVVVFYQLRAFNQRCANRVARFAEQLKQQREKRQQSRLLEAWNEKRRAEAQAVESKMGELRMQMQMLEDHLQAERHRLSMMNGFVRFFRKRSVTKSLDGIAENLAASQQAETALLHELEEIQTREHPDARGLSLAEKRSINMMILSFTQQMYLQFQDDGLAGLVKESGDKSAGAVRYGTRDDCEMLLKAVAGRAGAMEKITDSLDILKHRARLIAEKALFKNDDDAVPIPGTVSTVYIIDQNGLVREKDANLLGENYWSVAEAVSR